MKRLHLVLLLILLVLGFAFFTSKKQEKVHYHAGFLVYIDGILQDYSDTKFMHIEPCVVEGVAHEEDEQLEKAHLHDNVGDVVHVHRNSAKWKDLFVNLGITLPQNAPITVYTEATTGTLNDPITPYESVIIIVGENKNKEMPYITREHIEETERNSESC